MNVEPPRVLGHYRLLEKLGEGAMGAVWKALDLTLDREVAIKFVLPQLAAQAEGSERFDREA